MPKATEPSTTSPPLLSGKAALALIGIEPIAAPEFADTAESYDFEAANAAAELAVFQTVIAQCQCAPGPDALIILRVAEQVRRMLEDEAKLNEPVLFDPERYDHWNETKRIVIRTPAHTLAGLRAKAILVRHYHTPEIAQPSGAEDAAVAWSLAGDLLGLPSAVYGEARS